MDNGKEILKYCPNFHNIINARFTEGDNISNKLVDIYEDFIFKTNVNDFEKIKLVQDIDHVLNSYIENYDFRNRVKKELYTVKVKKTGKDVLTSIVEAIIKIFNNYIYETTRKIYIARWI